MSDFIVLGIIPGTQIQISFDTWLMLAGSLAGAAALWRLHWAHLVRNGIVTLRLYIATRQPLS